MTLRRAVQSHVSVENGGIAVLVVPAGWRWRLIKYLQHLKQHQLINIRNLDYFLVTLAHCNVPKNSLL